VDCLDFGSSEPRFLVILEAAGGPSCPLGRLQAAPGAHFDDFWDCCDLWGAPATKKYFHFEAEMQPLTNSLQ